MLLLHEVHQVAGKQEDAFDDAYRDEYLPALGKSDGSRLLWYLRLAHGSGQAYTVVSITGCRDADGVGGAGGTRARRRPCHVVGQGRRHAPLL